MRLIHPGASIALFALMATLPAGADTQFRARKMTRDDVPQEVLDVERRVYEGQAREQGRSEKATEMMVSGNARTTQ